MEESSCDFLPKWSEDLDRILKSEGHLVAGSCLPFQKMRSIGSLLRFFQARNQSVVLIAQSAHGMDAANRCDPSNGESGKPAGAEGLNMAFVAFHGLNGRSLDQWAEKMLSTCHDMWEESFGWNIQFIQYMRPTACCIAGIAVKWLDAWQVWLHGSGAKKKHRGYQQLCERWSFWGFMRIHGIMGYNQSADFFWTKITGDSIVLTSWFGLCTMLWTLLNFFHLSFWMSFAGVCLPDVPHP